MKQFFKSRWIWTLAVFVVTAASYAQWSNPAEDVPVATTFISLLLSKSAPCRLFFTVPNSRGRSSATTGRCVLTSWPPRFPLSFINCHATAAAIGPSGHTSLRSCYETAHSTECDVCSAEGFYAYYKTKAGWTPAQIRAGIARHEYESIDLEKQ